MSDLRDDRGLSNAGLSVALSPIGSLWKTPQDHREKTSVDKANNVLGLR